MANWCITNYVIEGEKKELDSLYGMMKRLQEMEPPLVEKGFGPSWLGCLVKELGEDSEIVNCRGAWYDLERAVDTIRVVFETAWSPCYDVIELLKEKFPSLRFYYRAIEPGNQVFNKNDVEGKYFPENLYAIYNGDEVLALDEQDMLQKLKRNMDCPSISPRSARRGIVLIMMKTVITIFFLRSLSSPQTRAISSRQNSSEAYGMGISKSMLRMMMKTTRIKAA